MLAMSTCSFQSSSVLPKLQTCLKINPQPSSSLSLLFCPTWIIKQLFYGSKYPSLYSPFLGLLDVAADLLKDMSVVRGQHGYRYNVPPSLSQKHCSFNVLDMSG